MQIREVAELLKLVAAIDNRKVTPELVEAWHSVIGFMPFDVAKEALAMARKDDRVNWLEPKHLVSWARDAAFKLDREENAPLPESVVGAKTFSPQPTCREHGKKIMECMPCMRQLKPMAEDNQAKILGWAKRNLFA